MITWCWLSLNLVIILTIIDSNWNHNKIKIICKSQISTHCFFFFLVTEQDTPFLCSKKATFFLCYLYARSCSLLQTYFDGLTDNKRSTSLIFSIWYWYWSVIRGLELGILISFKLFDPNRGRSNRIGSGLFKGLSSYWCLLLNFLCLYILLRVSYSLAKSLGVRLGISKGIELDFSLEKIKEVLLLCILVLLFTGD